MSNQIIDMMAAGDRSWLEPYLESVALPKSFVIGDPGAVSSHTYFLVNGIASICAQAAGGLQLEAAMFGSEGMSDPWEHLTGVKTPFRTVMLYHGHGFRVPSHVLSKRARESDELRLLLSRYAHNLSIQFANTALAGACFPIEKRLARWLLMVSDRTWEETLKFTHATAADQLKVRRQSVTTALHVLDGLGLIQSARGSLVIQSRERLIKFAGGAYGL